MLLAIDIGNTHTVFGLMDGMVVRSHWRITSGMARTEDEIGMLLLSFFDKWNIDIKTISGVCISSVVPYLTSTYIKMSERYINYNPFIINSKIDLGFDIKYKAPSTVGADRLCNAAAGIPKYGAPLIILDFGTATTFDCISAEGDYLGGVISPGIETSIKSLHLNAAKLPEIELRFPETAIGKTTEESMQIGIVRGTVFMVESMIKAIGEELSVKPFVAATGGLAEVISLKTDLIDAVDPNLSLEGIAVLFARNKKRRK
jgi:type III pantothenate kinase